MARPALLVLACGFILGVGGCDTEGGKRLLSPRGLGHLLLRQGPVKAEGHGSIEAKMRRSLSLSSTSRTRVLRKRSISCASGAWTVIQIGGCQEWGRL